MDRSRCKECKAAILWVPSEATGKLMPLDAEPTSKGNVAIVDGKGVVRSGNLSEQFIDPAEFKYISHFATCPSAEKFRKKKAE